MIAVRCLLVTPPARLTAKASSFGGRPLPRAAPGDCDNSSAADLFPLKALGCRDPGRFCGPTGPEPLCVEAPQTDGYWPGCPTTSAGVPPGPGRSRAGAGVPGVRAASRGEDYFLVGAPGG